MYQFQIVFFHIEKNNAKFNFFSKTCNHLFICIFFQNMNVAINFTANFLLLSHFTEFKSIEFLKLTVSIDSNKTKMMFRENFTK